MSNMNEKLSFVFYITLQKAMGVYKRIFCRGKRYRPRSLGGIKVHSAQEGNDYIREKILSGEPFAAIRYGGVEMNSYLEGKMFKLGLRKTMRQQVADNFQRQAGFFPNDVSYLPQFTELMDETSGYADMLGAYDTRMQNFVVKHHARQDLFIADNRALEPYYFMHKQPWTQALKGKRVLVIHPFEDSIRKQYQIREKLFEDPDILPEFELYTLKAVQTICATRDDRFQTWFDALNYMFEQAMKIPFDVAIIGCGAYGQPLACMLRKAGKQVVLIGGATQILFGIRGKRWELGKNEISPMFNEYWVRPTNEETPANKSRNEFGGAYW